MYPDITYLANSNVIEDSYVYLYVIYDTDTVEM